MKRSRASASIHWGHGENDKEADKASTMKETVSNFRDSSVRNRNGDNINSLSDELSYNNRHRRSQNGRKCSSHSSPRRSNSRRRDRRHISHSSCSCSRSHSKYRTSNKRRVQMEDYSSSSSSQENRHSSGCDHFRRRSRSRSSSSQENCHTSDYDHSRRRSSAYRGRNLIHLLATTHQMSMV